MEKRESGHTPRPSKYGFKTVTEMQQQDEAAKRAKANPTLVAWNERLAVFLEEQQSLRQLADEISPKVEDVLRDWLVINKDLYTDPFVARSENGANWAVFRDEDEESYIRNLWTVSLTQDWSKTGAPLMLAVDTYSDTLEGLKRDMQEVLSSVTGIPAYEPLSHGSIDSEWWLVGSDIFNSVTNVPVRPAQVDAYYRVHGFIKYRGYLTLAMNWVRLEA